MPSGYVLKKAGTDRWTPAALHALEGCSKATFFIDLVLAQYKYLNYFWYVLHLSTLNSYSILAKKDLVVLFIYVPISGKSCINSLTKLTIDQSRSKALHCTWPSPCFTIYCTPCLYISIFTFQDKSKTWLELRLYTNGRLRKKKSLSF